VAKEGGGPITDLW